MMRASTVNPSLVEARVDVDAQGLDPISEAHLLEHYFTLLRMGFPHTAAAIENILAQSLNRVSEPREAVTNNREQGVAETHDPKTDHN